MAQPDIGRRLSISPTSSLPLPRSLRQNKSFTQLARFIGFSAADDQRLATDSGSDTGDGGEDDLALSNAGDDDQDGDADEESLMWDAQTALIAHQPALAAKYYATAALPPHSSPAACLALGNLLARGSGLAQVESESPQSPASPTGAKMGHSNNNLATARLPHLSWFTSFFRHQAPNTQLSPSIPEDEPAPRIKRLASNGWELPTYGKRVVRNVEAMGKAGGWLVLGIGLIIESEAHRAAKLAQSRRKNSDEDGAIVFFDSKGKGRSHQNVSADATQASRLSMASSETAESLAINAPDDDHDNMTPSKRIKLLYDLLTPLVQLYRHGHIQRHDPVALPPISHSQLPRALNPKGDKERGRNTWFLGSAVASKLLDLPLLTASPNLGKEATARRHGVLIMANYIRGMTSSAQLAEPCFKNIIRLGPCGLDVPDDLVSQSYRRLKSVLKATGGSPVSEESNPFALDARSRRRRKSNGSLVSTADSTMTTSLRLMTPVKSTTSLASLAYDSPMVEASLIEFRHGATSSLRDIQKSQRRIQSARESPVTSRPPPWWPTLEGWSMATPRQTVNNISCHRATAHNNQHPSLPREFESVPSKVARKPQLRVIASSPQLHSGLLTSPPSSRSSRLLPFEPKEAVAPIDPELAALELASALTKHVQCSVCGADGVNFPNCRKCGLTFCSRPCRIDEKGAGNGKRHVCGAWESRKLLEPPSFPSVPDPTL